ncbi:hypothetical protein HBE96_20820 [Clostridium sp. P21]|uniref:Uncharacterized protein n=1 Tax=Clostridium muellerianum TaxID=2716538 RepID=A0A7Y0EK99_9CLOT|nr:hypothetical protein [Clostridium muellerianum]NMM65036.1 hypothetical protein [Clostridium muellerianum]
MLVKRCLLKADITSEVITNVAAISEEQTVSMHEMGKTENKLDELVIKLKSEVDRFKI